MKEKYQKVDSDIELLKAFAPFEGKKIIEIGSENGQVVRWFSSKGAEVYGVDNGDNIYDALEFLRDGNEQYVEANPKKLPFSCCFADMIFFIASLHLIPQRDMPAVLSECKRILKPSGQIVIIEPVAEKGCYYELIKLMDEDIDSQAYAEELIADLEKLGLEVQQEKFYYFERSIRHFDYLTNVRIEDDGEREKIVQKANKLIKKHGEKIFKSTCRLNVLRKKK